MGLAQGGSKQFQATPPDKGSFPLDHEGRKEEDAADATAPFCVCVFVSLFHFLFFYFILFVARGACMIPFAYTYPN